MALFLNPPEPAAMASHAPTGELMEALQLLQPDLDSVFISIVAQRGAYVDRGPEGELIDRVALGLPNAMLAATSMLDQSPFRAVLAGGVLPEMLAFAAAAPSTVLLYRYRQVVDAQTWPAGSPALAFSAESAASRLREFVLPHLPNRN